MAAHQSMRYGVITGAASGLGRAIALRLAKDGWRLALADLNCTGCEETKLLVERAGGSARVEQLDVRDEPQWLALRDTLQREWPHCDLIVNNAGVVASGCVQE